MSIVAVRVVGWLVEVVGDVNGVAVRMCHGPWSDQAKAQAAAKAWNAAFVRANKPLVARHFPLYGKGVSDRDGVWENARNAMDLAQVRRMTQVKGNGHAR